MTSKQGVIYDIYSRGRGETYGTPLSFIFYNQQQKASSKEIADNINERKLIIDLINQCRETIQQTGLGREMVKHIREYKYTSGLSQVFIEIKTDDGLYQQPIIHCRKIKSSFKLQNKDNEIHHILVDYPYIIIQEAHTSVEKIPDYPEEYKDNVAIYRRILKNPRLTILNLTNPSILKVVQEKPYLFYSSPVERQLVVYYGKLRPWSFAPKDMTQNTPDSSYGILNYKCPYKMEMKPFVSSENIIILSSFTLDRYIFTKRNDPLELQMKLGRLPKQDHHLFLEQMEPLYIGRKNDGRLEILHEIKGIIRENVIFNNIGFPDINSEHCIIITKSNMYLIDGSSGRIIIEYTLEQLLSVAKYNYIEFSCVVLAPNNDIVSIIKAQKESQYKEQLEALMTPERRIKLAHRDTEINDMNEMKTMFEIIELSAQIMEEPCVNEYYIQVLNPTKREIFRTYQLKNLYIVKNVFLIHNNLLFLTGTTTNNTDHSYFINLQTGGQTIIEDPMRIGREQFVSSDPMKYIPQIMPHLPFLPLELIHIIAEYS